MYRDTDSGDRPLHEHLWPPPDTRRVRTATSDRHSGRPVLRHRTHSGHSFLAVLDTGPEYQSANALSFVFYIADWEVVRDIFSCGYHVGALFAHSDHPNGLGGSMHGQMTNVNFDYDGTTVQWTFLGQSKSWTSGTSYSINDNVIPTTIFVSDQKIEEYSNLTASTL